MAIIHKHSAGGLIYNDGRVLTINWRAKSSIEFPKGGIEVGESAEKAALREVEEETGYRAQIVASLGAIDFDYEADGQAYTKTVDYFLMEINDASLSSPRPQREVGEDFDDLWLSVRQARRRLTYDDGRLILQRAVDIMKLLVDDELRNQRHVKLVARRMAEQPDFIPIVIDCLLNGHRGLAMRAADSLKRFVHMHVGALQPFTAELVQVLARQTQKEVRCNLAQILPLIDLTGDQLRDLLKIWTNDFYTASSDMVRTASLQAIHDIAENYAPAQKKLDEMLDAALENGASTVKVSTMRRR